MPTITIPGTQAGLKRFNIRIVTGGETAIQTALARTSAQAWNIAFDLAERLLGDKPPRSISVKPAQVRSGLYLQPSQTLQPRAVRIPVDITGGGYAPIVVKVNAPLIVNATTEADGLQLIGRQGAAKPDHATLAAKNLVSPVQHTVSAVSLGF
mgnify:CR=1 FL=1